jgi:hypothetical protein
MRLEMIITKTNRIFFIGGSYIRRKYRSLNFKFELSGSPRDGAQAISGFLPAICWPMLIKLVQVFGRNRMDRSRSGLVVSGDRQERIIRVGTLWYQKAPDAFNLLEYVY